MQKSDFLETYQIQHKLQVGTFFYCENKIWKIYSYNPYKI